MSRERRRLFQEEEPEAEPGRYGCPMLMRSRFDRSSVPTAPTMRCALGWALHNASEAALCAATEVVTDCWKAHPERAAVVVLTTTNAETAAVADD